MDDRLRVCFPVTPKAAKVALTLTCSIFSYKTLTHGMTIRTARLPRAGNLLSRAGEDLSGLPDWASRYQFLKFFY